MKTWTDKALALAIVAAVAFLVLQALGLTEQVAAREIVKSCYQSWEFAVGKESFDCYPHGVTR